MYKYQRFINLNILPLSSQKLVMKILIRQNNNYLDIYWQTFSDHITRQYFCYKETCCQCWQEYSRFYNFAVDNSNEQQMEKSAWESHIL